MEDFHQICVWTGVTLGDLTPEEFEQFMQDEFEVRTQFKEVAITNGSAERDEIGGRSDLIFAIHDNDISQFAIARLAVGIRWWEDVVSYNDGAYLYTDEVLTRYPVRW